MTAAPDPPATAIDLGGGVWVAREEARFTFSRSGGPGGQNVNKVSTRAELRVDPAAIRGLDAGALGRLRSAAAGRMDAAGRIIVVRDETRSQLDNRAACIEMLARLIAEARVVPKHRRKTRPSRGSRERRLEGKRRESEKKRGRGRPSSGE